jgi:hypothetical protein
MRYIFSRMATYYNRFLNQSFAFLHGIQHLPALIKATGNVKAAFPFTALEW